MRGDEQKPHKRPSLRGELALDNEALGSVGMVNAALVHGKFAFLPGEICTACGATE